MRPHLVALCVTASCYDPAIKLGVPCSDTGDCPGGQECDALTNVCMEPTELVTWRDDTAADFAQPGATFINAIVEEPGAVGPIPYLTGSVRLAGIAADTIGDESTATWATASAGTVTGRAFAASLDIDFGDVVPRGLGLPTGDGVTVLVEGEVYIDTPGMWAFELVANDKGFVEIAAPGGDFTRLVSDADTATEVPYSVQQAGWYRIRGAFTDNAEFMSFELRADSPALNGAFRPFSSDQLRARIDDLQGYVIDGFDEAALTDSLGSSLDTQPLDRAIPPDPNGLPVGMFGWSLRWSGQIRIDVEGDYTFSIVSFHGHRVWIDGVDVANNFSTTATTTSMTAPVHLVPGWHDFVADVTKEDDATDGQMSVTVASGPELAGQAIPIDRVRPLTARAVRWFDGNNNTNLAIPDGSSTTRTVTLDIPAGFVPSSIETSFSIDHAARAQVSLVLDPAAGANMTLIAFGSLGGAGGFGDHASVPATSFGGTWNFIVSDNTTDALVGTLDHAAVTAFGSFGTPPFPPMLRYELPSASLATSSASALCAGSSARVTPPPLPS